MINVRIDDQRSYSIDDNHPSGHITILLKSADDVACVSFKRTEIDALIKNLIDISTPVGI